MSTVEIRNYDGDGSDLADLIGRTWSANFGGKQWFPVWDHAYLSWRLLDERGGGRGFLVSAYRGSKIIGCLLAEPLNVQVRGETVKATLSSWLSVDPEARVPNLAMRLVEGLRQRHKQHGIAVSIGVTSSDHNAPSRRFWDSLAQRKPDDFRFLGPVAFWTRIFDARAAAAAGLSAFDRIASRFAGLIPAPSSSRQTAPEVRAYRATDVSRCLSWLHSQASTADLHILWTPSRLDLQLGHPYTRTLLFDRGGEDGGFINYYSIDWSGARVIRVAVIDLFAGNLGLSAQLELLRAAERKMIDEGIQVAVAMVSRSAPIPAMLAAGFLPAPAHLDFFCIFPDPALRLQRPLSYHLLFT